MSAPWSLAAESVDVKPDAAFIVEQLGLRPQPEVAAPGFGRAGPQAFLVCRGAEAETLRVHFHVVDQFQWFVHGGGKLGGHDVATGTLHYADRFTPYGPLHSGSAGLAFSTLRVVSDTGAYYMPEHRESLKGRRAGSPAGAKRRQQSWNLISAATDFAGEWQDLVADSDGLRVAIVDVAENAAVPAPTITASGAYLAVVAGAALADGVLAGPGALTWDVSGEPRHLVAARPGTRVAVFQLPDPVDRAA